MTTRQTRSVEQNISLNEFVSGCDPVVRFGIVDAIARNHGVTVEAAEQRLKDAAQDPKQLPGLNLTGVDLSQQDLSLVKLNGVILRGAKLSGATLRKTVLSDADLTDADLTGANMLEATLFRTTFRQADLKGANLQGAMMRLVDMEGADLTNANLTDAKLGSREALLNRSTGERGFPSRVIHVISEKQLVPLQIQAAFLRGADLTRADFTGADLNGVALIDTTLTGTCFRETNLCGAVLRGANGLENVDQTDSVHDYKTKWPKGFGRDSASGAGGWCIEELGGLIPAHVREKFGLVVAPIASANQ